jgi:hypothetical protein
MGLEPTATATNGGYSPRPPGIPPRTPVTVLGSASLATESLFMASMISGTEACTEEAGTEAAGLERHQAVVPVDQKTEMQSDPTRYEVNERFETPEACP